MATGTSIKVLVIDSDPIISNYLKNYISSFGYQVLCADKNDALSKLSMIDPSLIIINDMSSRNQPIDKLKSLSEYYGRRPILFLSNYPTNDSIYTENDLEYIDFISKPIDITDLKNKIIKLSSNFITNIRPNKTNNTIKFDVNSNEINKIDNEESYVTVKHGKNINPYKDTEINDKSEFSLDINPHLLVGNSRKIKEVKSVIDQVAKTDITVLIGGESGTGKELVARSLFNCSLRKEKPFIKVLCAAIPEGLLESELFGHEKGSFTGAYTKKPGKFEFAHHGTIFLDEIGEIPFSLQAKLLQVLQDSEFSRLGGNEVKVDVRIIAATNRNLEKSVAEGTFREDLFYRLNVVSIQLPSLRERKEDIPILTELFLIKYNKQFNKTFHSLSKKTLESFMDYDWPGNVRELENTIKRIVVLGDEAINLNKILEPKENITIGTESVTNVRVEDKPQIIKNDIDIPFQEIEKKEYSLKKVGRDASRKAEGELILEVLEITRWNRKEAAKVLGVSYKALLYKIKECGLQIQE